MADDAAPLDLVNRVIREDADRHLAMLNAWRAAIWGVVSVVGFAQWSRGNAPLIAPLTSVAAVLAAAPFARKNISRERRESSRWFLPVLDCASLGSFIYTGTHFLRTQGQITLADHQAFGGINAGLLAIVCVNALSASVTAITAAWLAALVTYVVVMHALGMITPLSAFDFVLVTSVFLVLRYNALRTKNLLFEMKTREQLERFLPRPIAERVRRDPSSLALGGEEQIATVLFADIRNFTAMSSSMSPTAVVAMLNEYFDAMVAVIFEHGGVLDKFIGDGVCAVFDANGGADHARRGVSCAAARLARLEVLNEARRARDALPLSIGIGLHTGVLVAGAIGSTAHRLEYTHIGDTVNVASRIEGLCKEVGAPLVMSAATWEAGGEKSGVRAVAVEPIAVKGKSEALRVFAVRGPEVTPRMPLAGE